VIQSGASVSFAEFNNLDAREAATEYKLNRMFLITGVMSILPNLFYLIMPTSSLIMTLAMAALALVEGGRSSFLCYMISASIMVMVGRKRGQIKLAANKMISVMIFIVCVTFGAKVIYEAAVSRNLLGEEELSKYEKQAQSKIGLLSGRSHFISVFYAVCDSPILGHGSWALDEKGFEVRAMEWMEDEEGLERYYKTGRIGHIKGHSHIWAAWTWHGVLGAAFWVYVLTIMWRTLSKRMGVVPELFGYFALSIPSFAWAIFFSPFGDRVLLCFTCALCLLIRRIDEVQKRTMAQMDNGILARR
jgi:hypothetical protein